jgi:hypothetical protein
MDDVNYKGHRLFAFTWRNGDGKWKPNIQIIDLSSGNRIQLPSFGKTYGTEKDAEQAGLTFAKKWIDDGMPPVILEADYFD